MRLSQLIWGLLRSGAYPSEWKGVGVAGNSVVSANISAFAVVVFLAIWLAEEELEYIFKGASARLEAFFHPHPTCQQEKGRKQGAPGLGYIQI